MYFRNWITFVAFFTFVENVPTTESNIYEDQFYIDDLNNVTREMGNRQSQVFNAEFERNNIKFFRALPSAVIAHFSKNSFTVELELILSLEIYLRDFNRSFETGNFPFNFVINPFKRVNATYSNSNSNTSISLEYPNLDQRDLNLKLPSDHQYKPHEVNRINQETKNLLKLLFDTKQSYYPSTSLESTWDGILKQQKNEFERLHSINTIPATNYTLDNVTIDGLENIQKIVIYLQSVYRTVVGPVRGSMIQNFHSAILMPVELHFKADIFYVSSNEELGTVHVRAEGYSIVNTKVNKTLSDQQSESIMKDIEAAFELFLAAPVDSGNFEGR